MIRLYRRHVKSCTNHGKETKVCPLKVKCPVYFEGTDGSGTYRHRRLIDPETGEGVRDWTRASILARELETPYTVQDTPERCTIKQAIDAFMLTKRDITRPIQTKYRKLLMALQTFMEASPRNHVYMEQITPLDLITWQSGWSDENSTRRNRRDTIKSFFKFCVNAELIKSNPSHAMPTIKEVRTDRKPFEPAEMEAVFRVLPDFADEYGRKGQAIAQQVDAFVHVMRYTGLDCSTLVKLEKSHVYVNEGKIMTYRQKTGSDVTVPVPDWVLAKLMACPHDSEKYFFWSGEGELHTRATKWFTRIRKLLNLAGLKERTAHNFRHTYAVELLIAGTPISDVARLLGHAKVSTTEKHYAMWVKRRTDALHDQVRRTWANDALHVQHSSVPPSDAPSPQRVN